MKRVVLDASAVMAFLEDRPGADEVEQLIGGAIEGERELLMSLVNWGEVYYSIWSARGGPAARKTLAEIAQLPIAIIDGNGELTRTAAELKAEHKLPYVDCFAAALAKQRQALLATADKDFARLGKYVEILWIAKGK